MFVVISFEFVVCLKFGFNGKREKRREFKIKEKKGKKLRNPSPSAFRPDQPTLRVPALPSLSAEWVPPVGATPLVRAHSPLSLSSQWVLMSAPPHSPVPALLSLSLSIVGPSYRRYPTRPRLLSPLSHCAGAPTCQLANHPVQLPLPPCLHAHQDAPTHVAHPLETAAPTPFGVYVHAHFPPPHFSRPSHTCPSYPCPRPRLAGAPHCRAACALDSPWRGRPAVPDCGPPLSPGAPPRLSLTRGKLVGQTFLSLSL